MKRWLCTYNEEKNCREIGWLICESWHAKKFHTAQEKLSVKFTSNNGDKRPNILFFFLPHILSLSQTHTSKRQMWCDRASTEYRIITTEFRVICADRILIKRESREYTIKITHEYSNITRITASNVFIDHSML